MKTEIDKDKLIDALNEDESLTDSQRREEYFSEIENERQEREWEDSF